MFSISLNIVRSLNLPNFYKREVITLLKGGVVNYPRICINCMYNFDFVTGDHALKCKCPKYAGPVAERFGTYAISYVDYAPHCSEFQLDDRVRR